MWIVTLIIMMTINSMVYGDYTYSDYNWKTYDGHWYALTMDIGTEYDAEAEALAIGGHLVAINTHEENGWLISRFGFGIELDQAIKKHMWIGFCQDHNDPFYDEPGGGLKWISGEPVTYTDWGGLEPNILYGEDFGIIRKSPDIFWQEPVDGVVFSIQRLYPTTPVF